MLPSSPPDSHVSLRRRTLLLVDDDPGVIRGLCRMLQHGCPEFRVNAAAGTAQALEALSERTYDVVITDLHMPGAGGRAVLEALIEFYPETARIIHSSQLESGDTLALRKAAHVVLAKPASETELTAAIELALTRVASQRSQTRSG